MKVSQLAPKAEFLLAVSRLEEELGADAACEDCGHDNLIALSDEKGPIVCRECEAARRGVSPLQAHHLGGRASGTRTVLVAANTHAVLSLLQECFWKGVHDPGSAYAVGFDLAAYLAYTTGRTR